MTEMGRVSTKENKTLYQLAREKMGLSRERASELTGIEPSKIERIENEKILQISPYDVYDMAEAYREPMLCNHCSAYLRSECLEGLTYMRFVTIDVQMVRVHGGYYGNLREKLEE